MRQQEICRRWDEGEEEAEAMLNRIKVKMKGVKMKKIEEK